MRSVIEANLEYTRPKKLPVIHAAFTVYALTWRNGVTAAKMVAPWLIAILVILAAQAWFIYSIDPSGKMFSQEVVDFSDSEVAFIRTAIVSFAVVFWPLWLLAWSAIAIQWHLCLLKGKKQNVGIRSTERNVFFYLFVSILYFVIALLPAIPVFFLISPFFIGSGNVADWSILGLAAVSIVISGTMYTIFIRLGISLPAIAVDRANFRFFRGWESAEGNFLRIAAFAVLTLTPFLLLIESLGRIAEAAGERFPSAAPYLLLALTPLDLFYVFISVSQLTVLYRFFIEEEPI